MLAQSAKEHEDIKVKLERANKQVSCLLKKERESVCVEHVQYM